MNKLIPNNHETEVMENTRRQEHISPSPVNKDLIPIPSVLAAALLVLVSLGLAIYSYHKINTGLTDAYESTKTQVAQEVYDSYYNTAYTISESAHHVSNQVLISIEDVQEISKLEVLQVSSTTFITQDNDESGAIDSLLSSISAVFTAEETLWLKVPGTAVFTVDLSLAEFIVDNQRSCVWIRIPNPEISEFTIDYSNVEQLYFKSGGLLTEKSGKVGVNKAQTALADADLQLRNAVLSNQRFYQSARNAAETILKNLVLEFNPGVEELTVVVEYID